MRILLEAYVHVHVVLEPFTSNALAVYVVVPKEMVAIVTRNLITWLHVTEDFHTRHVLTSGNKLVRGGEGGEGGGEGGEGGGEGGGGGGGEGKEGRERERER